MISVWGGGVSGGGPFGGGSGGASDPDGPVSPGGRPGQRRGTPGTAEGDVIEGSYRREDP